MATYKHSKFQNYKVPHGTLDKLNLFQTMEECKQNFDEYTKFHGKNNINNNLGTTINNITNQEEHGKKRTKVLYKVFTIDKSIILTCVYEIIAEKEVINSQSTENSFILPSGDKSVICEDNYNPKRNSLLLACLF